MLPIVDPIISTVANGTTRTSACGLNTAVYRIASMSSTMTMLVNAANDPGSSGTDRM
ncbi:hypothetical protein C1Y40_01124 [Mycobacterium talmoniae]|uniref:Uncharacterized protein n=1 Tax=Mycobacterium talmoniae TaxID=1858794 RepID=A0A2S8BPV2_9MYCO|nr:hypothetical protein C1Y40_01124 [Mycobacterium talmoniae]